LVRLGSQKDSVKLRSTQVFLFDCWLDEVESSNVRSLKENFI